MDGGRPRSAGKRHDLRADQPAAAFAPPSDEEVLDDEEPDEDEPGEDDAPDDGVEEDVPAEDESEDDESEDDEVEPLPAPARLSVR